MTVIISRVNKYYLVFSTCTQFTLDIIICFFHGIIYLVQFSGNGSCMYVLCLSYLSFLLLWIENIPPSIMSPSLYSRGFSGSPLLLDQWTSRRNHTNHAKGVLSV